MPLPATAEQVYERLRAEVLRAEARPEGLGAVAFHGLAEGLRLLCSNPCSPAAASAPVPRVQFGTSQRELLHLLANMVLQTQSEVMHVY